MSNSKIYFDHEKLKAYQDLLAIKEILNSDELHAGKEILRGIVSMLVGLIQYHQPDRLRENAPEYHTETQE
jgi:hypothetical protein